LLDSLLQEFTQKRIEQTQFLRVSFRYEI